MISLGGLQSYLPTWSVGAMPPVSMLTSVPLQSPISGASAPLPSRGSAVQGSVSSLLWSTPAPPLPTVWPGGVPSIPAAFSGASAAPPLGSVSSAGMMLSSAGGTLPQKLVDKVRAGHFVEMREFLVDNMRLLDRLESVHGSGLLPSFSSGPRPRLREVTSLMSWIGCFLAYVAVGTSDHVTRDQLAYARLILGEAQLHGGTGWLDYDRASRQQRAVNPGIPWNTLDSGLHGRLILGQRSGSPNFCSHCHESDHSDSSCALAALQQQQVPTTAQPYHSSRTYSSDPRSSRRGRGQSGRRSAESLEFICMSWNRGACTYPGSCSYRHVCATCRRRHRAKDCPSTPDSAEYKRQPVTSGK